MTEQTARRTALLIGPLRRGPRWTSLSLAGIGGAVASFEGPRAATPAHRHGAEAVQQTCAIADSELWADRPIDSSSCSLDGDGDAAHLAQNRVKNELCAGAFVTVSPAATPARVTQFSFRGLQEEANDIRTKLGLGARTVPPDRARFQDTVHTTSFGDDLGEGALVRYVGFLLEGHFTGEEGVNCDRKKQVNFDIHMAFVEQRPPASPTTSQAEALECSSITAEIIPRQRPEPWDLLGSWARRAVASPARRRRSPRTISIARCESRGSCSSTAHMRHVATARESGDSLPACRTGKFIRCTRSTCAIQQHRELSVRPRERVAAATREVGGGGRRERGRSMTRAGNRNQPAGVLLSSTSLPSYFAGTTLAAVDT